MRAGKGEGARAVRPDRIGEDIEPGDLDEERRVADHGDAKTIAVDSEIGPGLRKRAVIAPGPSDPPAAELPTQEMCEPTRRGAARIEEADAVEMVRNRPFVIGIAAFPHLSSPAMPVNER